MAGFPAGYLLAWLAKDELVAGRKWFLLLSAVSFLAAIVIVFIGFSLKFVVILSLFSMIIVSQIAVWKSYDKRWVR